MKYEVAKSALESVDGTSFIGLDTETDVKLKGGKKNPLQGHVRKKMTGASVMVFSNKNKSGYESLIKRRLVNEGKDPETFTVGPRTWGERIPNTPFIEHKDNYYPEVIFLKSGNVEYLVDGVVTDPKTIEGLDLTEKKVNEESQGGLEKDNRIVIRTFSLESVTGLRVDHMEIKNT